MFLLLFSIGFIEVSDHTPVTAVTKIRSVDNIKRGGTFFICATRNGFHRFANSIKTTGNHYTVKGLTAAACSGVSSVAALTENAVAESSADAEGVLKLHKIILRLAQTSTGIVINEKRG